MTRPLGERFSEGHGLRARTAPAFVSARLFKECIGGAPTVPDSPCSHGRDISQRCVLVHLRNELPGTESYVGPSFAMG